MELKEAEETEPVSPSGQYLNSSALSLSVLGVLESEIPIDDSQCFSLLKDIFLPINPRFSSIMVILNFNLILITIVELSHMKQKLYYNRLWTKMEKSNGRELR